MRFLFGAILGFFTGRFITNLQNQVHFYIVRRQWLAGVEYYTYFTCYARGGGWTDDISKATKLTHAEANDYMPVLNATCGGGATEIYMATQEQLLQNILR